MYRNTFKETVAMAAFMIVIAIICLWMVKSNLIDTNIITWDSDISYIMCTAPLVLIVYSLIMCIITYFEWDRYYSVDVEMLPDPKVGENNGQWKAKAVHWLSKHPH